MEWSELALESQGRISIPWGGPTMARISGLPWPKAGHILEMAGKNKFELPK